MNQERNRTDYLTTKNIKNWELISKKSRLIKTMNVSTTKEHVHSSFLLVYGKLNCLLFIPKLSRSTHNSWKSTHLSHLMFEFWVSLKIDTFKIKYTSILWQRYGYSRCITHEFFRAAAFRWNPNFLHQFCRFSQIFPRSSQDFPIFSHDFPMIFPVNSTLLDPFLLLPPPSHGTGDTISVGAAESAEEGEPRFCSRAVARR